MTNINMPLTDIELPNNKKVFFASDFHLGAPNHHQSRLREDKIISWLNSIAPQAHTIFLLGDVFDFWFEYKHVIPKGFTRFLGKLASLSDQGIHIIIFSGNHDMWMYDYLTKELSIEIYHDPQSVQINNSLLYLGHGDGLGGGDQTYKFLKKVFRSPVCQWAFRWLHPNIGMAIAHAWSRSSRKKSATADETFLGDDEWIYQYCKEVEQNTHHNAYILGHRHLPLDLPVGNKSRYINLGEWISQYHYASIDHTGNLQLIKYTS